MQDISSQLTTSGMRNVDFPVQGKDNGIGYLTACGSSSKLGLIILQEWWGLNQNICTLTDIFGELGFRALAVDVYRGKVAKDREEAGHFKVGLDFEGAIRDIEGAVKYLKDELKCTKVGALGYCMGGALVLAAATRDTGLDVGVAYYGIPDTHIYKPELLKIPVLGNFGIHDEAFGFSDPETAKNYDKLATEAGKCFRLIFYDAQHSFNNKDTPRYNEQQAKVALYNTLEFFSLHMQQQ